MPSRAADALTEVATYYTAKLAEYGTTARGADWNSRESQELRFEQLCRIIDGAQRFSLNDLGCGYGALGQFLGTRYADFSYSGFDVAPSMIEAARRHCAGLADARFAVGRTPDGLADYGIASGIFNVRLSQGTEQWQAHIDATLDDLDRTSRKGFAFNCLTRYSDADRMRDYLHYADPAHLFDHCVRRYSRHVALLHDYGLYEFTILVRKA